MHINGGQGAHECTPYDEAKRAANLARHGVDFAVIGHFDWTGAVVEPDDRFDYGEVRFEATGMIAARLDVVVFTPRAGRNRLITLRKTNSRDQARWERRGS